MTRLITEWLTPIQKNVYHWDERLQELTGCSLASLAFKAALSDPLRKIDYSTIPAGAEEGGSECNPAAGKKAAVVTITSGEGEIGSFASSVAAILKAIGMDAKTTEQKDIAGIYEALSGKYDLIFMADDDRYIAMNTRNGNCGENDRCTALGYLQALEECHCKRIIKERPEMKLTGPSFAGEQVLLMGFGRVGRVMYDLLRSKGADITVFDSDIRIRKELDRLGIKQIRDTAGIAEFSLIVDLTSEGDWLDPSMLRDNVIIAAPGVPLSISESRLDGFRGILIHDDLEIGTAVMAMHALLAELPVRVENGKN